MLLGLGTELQLAQRENWEVKAPAPCVPGSRFKETSFMSQHGPPGASSDAEPAPALDRHSVYSTAWGWRNKSSYESSVRLQKGLTHFIPFSFPASQGDGGRAAPMPDACF